MDNCKLARECILLIGGKDNIESMTHCTTRLRFKLKDQTKASIDKLKEIDGVLGVKEVGAQTQVIIGPSVRNVFEEIEKQVGDLSSTNAHKNSEKTLLGAKVLDIISGIFAPIIAVLTAGGMIKAFLLILVMFGLSKDTQEYYMLNFISDSAFYFLPVLLAFSSANKFGCNPYLAAVVGGMMLHPNWGQLVSQGESVTFFQIPVTLCNYSSSVLPIILTVFIMSYIEKFADRVSPNHVKAILKPLLTVGITSLVAFILVGPLGMYLGRIFAVILSYLDSNIPVLVPTIVGAVFPLLVFVGMHLAIFPALQTVQLADMGYETVCGPGVLASNFAIAGATLAIAIKSKKLKTKEIGFSTGITALCGVTEPALYGIVMNFKKPLIAAMIGGGVGGLFAGIMHLKRYALATPGIPALPTFIGDDPTNIIKALITLAIGFSVSFVIAWIIGFEEESDIEDKDIMKENKKSENDIDLKSTKVINSPVKGKVINLSEIPDKVFSAGILGEGCGIEPYDEIIYSPCDAQVVLVAETGHAIGLKMDNGVEFLIHVGIDTVEMGGRGFEVLCKNGDKVKQGQKLLKFNKQIIEEENHPNTVVFLVVEPNGKKVGLINNGEVSEIEEIFSIE